MSKANKNKELYDFGPFRIDSYNRQLLRQNKPVPLQPKAFDILLVLVQNSGELVSKDDLMKAIWPDTFVEESNLSQHIFILRKALGGTVEEKPYIVTVPGRGYRFVGKVRPAPIHDQDRAGQVEAATEEEQIVVARRQLAKLTVERSKKGNLLPLIAAAATLVALVLAIALFWRSRKPQLTEKDSLVLADFDNKTGDSVFDDTLRQGLSAQLEQSPFLNLLSDRRIAQTLALMTQPRDAKLTHDLAHEVCQRTSSSATVEGSIAKLGDQYVLGLKAVDCHSGNIVADEQITTNGKEQVLNALGKVSATLRHKLGESLASVQRYDVPPQDVTTASLEALHSYSLAMKTRHGDLVIPIQLLQRAIAQDPNFAMAHAQLGVLYINLNETGKGADSLRKAYVLRNHVSERERFYIAAHYDEFVTGDLAAARNDYELWMNIYPRDSSPVSSLAAVYYRLGDFDKVLDFTRRGAALNGLHDQRLQPEINEIWADIQVNRLNEAKALALGAQANHVDDPMFHLALYMIDFLNLDTEALKHEVDFLVSNPTWGDGILGYEADTAGYSGQLVRARDFTRRASAAATSAGKKQTAAAYEAESAIREALLGNNAEAKGEIKKALAQSRAKDVIAMSALAASLAGDSAQATQLANDLSRNFPQDTIVQFNYLPTIHAALEVHSGNPAKAIESLAPAAPYECGVTAMDAGLSFYPVYVRGEAYLASKRAPAALAEFKKILDHSGVVQNEPIGALAKLGLARAYALSGDSAKSRAEYQHLLTLWKDADPDIPILKQAKAEYAKLQ